MESEAALAELPRVIEVTDGTFATDVIEESRRRPVVVDFWAEWCAPCRMIGPVLERLAEEQQGQILLAKLDVDANPQAAAAFHIQGIPAVKAFRDAAVVQEFVGAIPERHVREFIGGLLPSETDRLATQAAEAERSKRPDQAERLYRRALELTPNHPQSVLGLAGLLAVQGELEAARALLQPLRPDPEAERLLAAIDVSMWGAVGPDGQGSIAQAQRAAAEGKFGEALDAFLKEVASGGDQRDQARAAMLKIFTILGELHPLTREYRRRLSAVLF